MKQQQATTRKALRVIYGEQRSSHAAEIEALASYAADPHPDDTRVLDSFGLGPTVRAVLADGVDLPTAGNVASEGRYATEIQARAYAVALIHQAGRVLLWNTREYRPQRSAAAQIAAMYQASQTALRAKIAFPANGNVAIKMRGGGMGL